MRIQLQNWFWYSRERTVQSFGEPPQEIQFFLVSKFGPIKVELLRGLLDWAGEAKAILVGWDWGAGAANPQHEESK